MSNNWSPPNLSNSPFLVVEYEKNKALIGRDTNYQETLASIKKLFSSLKDTPDDIIRINSHIEGIDDTCRIADGIWSELLPRLTAIQVLVDNPTKSNEQEGVLSQSTRLEVQAKSEAIIYLHRRESTKRSSPVIGMYITRISLDCTIEQLIEQVHQQENIVGRIVKFRYGTGSISFTDTLSQNGLKAGSVVEIVIK